MIGRTKQNLVIIGAGAASLLLILALHHKRYAGTVTVLERQKAPNNDRIWSFWLDAAVPLYLRECIDYQWSNWRFSSETFSRKMTDDVHPYCSVRASSLNTLAERVIKQQANFDVIYDCDVTKIETSKTGATITTPLGQFTANEVVDTRPPPLHFQHRGLFQCFFGLEVRTQEDCFDESTADLMKNLSDNVLGVEFTYILPFSARHALIELTFFSKTVIEPAAIKKQLQHILTLLLSGKTYVVERQEQATLPMYAINLNKKNDASKVIYAGIAGGALRASTGYSFLNSQRSAWHTASQLMANKKLTAVSPVSYPYQLLDAMFLRVIRTKPSISTLLYASLLKRLDPLTFIRFMSESASYKELLKVVWSMPKYVFILALIRSFTSKSDNKNEQ